jgi:acetolactate synthase-1/2/3 large subunit
MFRDRQGRPLSADYAAMARAMGARGSTVEKPADLAGQLEEAIAAHAPTVLDVRVDADVRPLATGGWELPPLPSPRPSFGWDED